MQSVWAFVRRASFFGLVAVLLLFTTSTRAERLPVKTYTVADGLLRDTVTKIKQDSRGFLWFCTAEGISRFDGYVFTNFTTNDGLPDRKVNDFLETSNGSIYIATDGGLAKLNPTGLADSKDDPLFTVFVSDDPNAEKIRTLYEDKNHQVWAGTSDGLYKLIEANGRVVFDPVPLGKPLLPDIEEAKKNTLFVNTILGDRHGTLWIGTYGSGLIRLSQDGVVRRFTAPDDGFGDNKITDLLEDSEGRLWMSMRSDKLGGVCLLDEEANEQPVKKCYTTKDGLTSNWIRDMHETSDGQMWLATNFGLCEWQGKGGTPVCKTYSVKNDLCDDNFTVAEDKDGNLWTGADCGAKKIARTGFTTFNKVDGFDWAQIDSIFENSADELFVTTLGAWRGVSRFDGAKFSHVKPHLPDYVDYVGWGSGQTIWQDSARAWWIPTGYGLFRSPNNTSFEDLAGAALEKIETGATAHEVLRIFEDSRGDVWILTVGEANELLRWERAGNTWYHYTSQVEFSGYRFGTAFAEDRHGNVWIGASSDDGNSALIRYRDGEFRILTQAEGAPSGWIMDLFLDSRGRLWIASNNDGLWRLDNTDSNDFAFGKYSSANGLTSNSTASVTEDEFGRIYVGTWRGIDRLDPDTGQVEKFTTADGLPDSFVLTAHRDRKNNLWFGTGNGLARFVPEPPRSRYPPTIFITGLRVEGEPRSVSILGETVVPSLELNSDQKQISFDFIGLGPSLGEKLRYEYRLGNSDWTATTERTLNFADLAAGEYRFEVRAQTADRIYSIASATADFRIAAPIWQRSWFIVGLLILTAFLIYGFYRVRLARLLELERVRTRIATDLHDDIGANLTKIAILSEVAQQQSGQNTGANGKNDLHASVAEISRESVSAMGDIVWAINPKKDSLIGLTRRMRQYAEEILERRDIHLEFDAPTPVPDLKPDATIRRNIYLIFKESINNIVRHSSAANVKIDFRLVEKELVLQISDDGIGFDPETKYDGNGLLNIRKRAEDCGGRLEINSSESSGTKIVLRLKIRSAAWSWR